MSNKISRQKATALAMIGVVAAAAMVAAVSFAPIAASAQENGSDTSVKRFRAAHGGGIATDAETGDDFRSGLRLGWQYDNETDTRTVKRGALVISIDEERVRYEVLPETWEIEVAEDNLTFEANGQVENEDGEVFDVSVDGYLGGPVGFIKRLGTVWSVDGTMTGEGVEYDLHYVMVAHLGRVAVVDE